MFLLLFPRRFPFFLFNNLMITAIFTLSLHDALPISLLATAHALNRMDARLRKALPDSLRSHIGLDCLEDNTLVLAATSPDWASRARLITSDLLYEDNQSLDKQLRILRD